MKTLKMHWSSALKHPDILREAVIKYLDVLDHFLPPNNSSGTSAVAIDNKIEQAMDLVKSHLMFAVREEVEVLKEKIVELTGRINQLEYENTVLKAHASQETLQQLVVPLPQQQQLPQQPVPPQQQAPAPQAAPAPATMMGGGGGKAQQAPTSVS